jgi:predicted flap endonuclease-1-like 5' DNA nuclease
MADEARLHELLDLYEQAVAEGDNETAAKAKAAYQAESAGTAAPAAAAPQEPAAPAPPPKPQGSASDAAREAFLTVLSGAGATTLAGIAGMGIGAFQGADAGARAVEGVQEALTYRPRTQAGDNALATIAKPFEMLASGADAAGDYVLDATGSPLLATGARTLIEGAPDLLGLKMMRAAKVGSVKPKPHANPDVQLLRDEGVPVNRGQAGSKVMESLSRGADTVLGESKKVEAQKQAFNQAVLRRAGVRGNKIDDVVLKDLRDELSSEYNTLTSAVATRMDRPLFDALDKLKRDAQNEMRGEAGKITGTIDELMDEGMKSGQLEGRFALSMRERLGRYQGSANGSEKHFAKQVQKALDDAFERSAPRDLGERMRDARSRYRMLNQLEAAMRGNASGNISPSRLYTVLDQKRHKSSTDLRDLARAGKNVIPDRVGNSGTAARSADVSKVWAALTHPGATAQTIGTLGAGRGLNWNPALGRQAMAAAPSAAIVAGHGSGEALLAESHRAIDAYLRSIGAR